MKKLPIGIENFRLVRTECYYIDKTLLINDILSRPQGTAFLYTRPRRFGKSLALSMVKEFFDEKVDSAPLFEDTKLFLEHPETRKELNSSPVIRLNLASVDGASYDEMIVHLKEQMSILYQSFAELDGPTLNEHERQSYRQVVEKTEDIPALCSSLFLLSFYVSKTRSQKPVVLLVDEYDAPLNRAYAKGYYEEAVPFFRSFFSQAFKGNDNLRYGILTGVLQIAKESLFSGLNNLVVDNPLRSVNNRFGFTEEETKQLLADYQLSDRYDILKAYYDGYYFGGEAVFNPWSVFNYIQQRDLYPYWIDTGENPLFGHFPETEVTPLLGRLFLGEEVIVPLSSGVRYPDLAKDPSTFLSLLYFSGYLTAKHEVSPGKYALQIPNEEVRQALRNDIEAKYISSQSASDFYALRKCFLQGEEGELERALTRLLSSLSYYDFSDEKNYQILLLTFVSLLFPDKKVADEVNAGSGRLDLLVEDKEPHKAGFVVEIKYVKTATSRARLEKTAEAALSQIESKDYLEELRSHQANPILSYGIVFNQKRAVVKAKIEKK